MRVKNVSEFTNRLLNVIGITIGCLATFSLILATALLLPNPQDNGKTAFMVNATMLPSYLLFFGLLYFFGTLKDAATHYEDEIKSKLRLLQQFKDDLAELNNLLAKSNDELVKEELALLLTAMNGIKLEAKITAVIPGVDPIVIRNALEKKKQVVLEKMGKWEKYLPKKPWRYAFLEKRLHLTPVIS